MITQAEGHPERFLFRRLKEIPRVALRSRDDKIGKDGVPPHFSDR